MEYNTIFRQKAIDSKFPKGLPYSTLVTDRHQSYVRMNVTDKELSKEEKDVTKELEQYKESLLRYRYEQRYINERLDTSVSEAQIYEYYKSHAESFKAQRALVKARTLNINKESSFLASFKKLMCSDNVEDVIEADSLALKGGLKYHDFSFQWMDVLALAASIGVSYNEIKPCKKAAVIQFEDDNDNLVIIYLADVVGEGEVAPIEYVREKIIDSIISERKHTLLGTTGRLSLSTVSRYSLTS